MGGAAQRVLAVGGHDLAPRHAALIRIADPALEFAQQHAPAARMFARCVGCRVEQHLDAGRPRRFEPHSHQPEPEPPAQLHHVAPLPPPHRRNRPPRLYREGQINLVRHILPPDALQDQRQVERRLQLDDDQFVRAAHADHVAIGNLAFDVIALPFQEGFDGRIQIGFAQAGHGGGI